MSATPPTDERRRDRAVTPVIATVTLVAVSVVLAAVLGAAMLGLSGGLRPGPPAVTVDFTYVGESGDFEVYASIHGGETITRANTGNLTLVAETNQSYTVPPTRYPLVGGDDVILSEDTGGLVPPGTKVELVWEGPDGRMSTVIAGGRTPY